MGARAAAAAEPLPVAFAAPLTLTEGALVELNRPFAFDPGAAGAFAETGGNCDAKPEFLG
jgi:hypothetical protein